MPGSRQRIVAACALLSALAGGAAPIHGAGSATAGETAVRTYALPGHGALLLRVPKSWKDEVKRPSGGLPPTIALHPAGSEDPLFLLTPIWSPKGDKGFNSLEKVRGVVTEQMRQMAPSAAEKELSPEPLQGEQLSGFFFSATDKAPKKGDYEHLIQGAFAVGDLLLTATVLSHAKDSDGVRQAMTVLRDARHRKP